MPNLITRTNILPNMTKIMKRKANKIFAIIISLFILITNVLPVFAADETGKVLVTVVCKIEDESLVDDYSIVVVTLLNITTQTTEKYKLYEYNNFSEKFLMDKGDYSILYAKIDNRNDIVFEVESEPRFEIGNKNTIYFELFDSEAIEHPTTVQSQTQSTTKQQIYTLFNLSSTTGKDTSSVKEPVTESNPVTSSDSANTGTSNTNISKTTDKNTYSETETTVISDSVSTTVDAGMREMAKRGLIGVSVFISLIILAVIAVIIIKVRNK